MALDCDYVEYDLRNVRFQKPIGVCHTDIDVGGANSSIILSCLDDGSDAQVTYYQGNQQCSGTASSTQTITELMAEKGINL